MTDRTVLHVDPDENARERTAGALREVGFTLIEAGSIVEATADFDAVDCLVTEYELPGGDGLDFVGARVRPSRATCVVFTAAVDGIATDRSGTVAGFVDRTAPGARNPLVDIVDHAIAARTRTAYPLSDDEAPRLEALAEHAPVPERLEASLSRLTTLVAALFDLDGGRRADRRAGRTVPGVLRRRPRHAPPSGDGPYVRHAGGGGHRDRGLSGRPAVRRRLPPRERHHPVLCRRGHPGTGRRRSGPVLRLRRSTGVRRRGPRSASAVRRRVGGPVRTPPPDRSDRRGGRPAVGRGRRGDDR